MGDNDGVGEEVMTIKMGQIYDCSEYEYRSILSSRVLEAQTHALGVGTMTRAFRISNRHDEDVMQSSNYLTLLQAAIGPINTLPILVEKLSRTSAGIALVNKAVEQVFQDSWSRRYWVEICNGRPRTLRECLAALRRFLVKRWLELRIFIVITRRETSKSDESAANPLAVKKTKPKLSFPNPTSSSPPPERDVLRLNSQLLL